MSENCDHNCERCAKECGERKVAFSAKLNESSSIKKVIGIVSGKGGVGKSLVTSLLAVMMSRKGYSVAILDADITGPSIPKIFGVKEKAESSDLGIHPVISDKGIKIISINLLLENETEPVIWRGPILAGVVKQFWTDVVWGDVDYMFIDMPPGTGDVVLTVFQSLPVDGLIVVTSPQEMVSVIVSKAVKMAKLMKIPILGIIENMSWFECPDCGKKTKLFGNSHAEETAGDYGLKVLASVPIDPRLSARCDEGTIEGFAGGWLEETASLINNIK